MADGPRRYAFALGTFHAAVLVVAALMLLYDRGGLNGLGDLNTAVGLALFSLLWATSVAGTRWALSGVHEHSLAVALSRGIGGGAISGALFLAGLALGGVMVGLARSPGHLSPLDVPVLVIYFAVAGVAAAAVGGAVGFVFAVIDWTVLTIAGISSRWDPTDEAPFDVPR